MWAILIMLAILAFAFAGVRLFGVSVYSVLSGSMEPSIPTGSLVYATTCDASDLQVGDIVVWALDENTSNSPTYCTHRAIAIDYENELITTKGDANENAEASPLSFADVRGKISVVIPSLGTFLNFLKSMQGAHVSIAVLVLLFVYMSVPLFLSSRAGNEENERMYSALFEAQTVQPSKKG